MKQYPSQEYLREIFDYRDGCLYWKQKISNKSVVGQVAGYQNADQKYYNKVGINGGRYYCHRIIWIMFNGQVPDNLEIDHINRDYSDNRIENLRLVSRSQNSLNKNHSNIRKHHRRFVARITFNGALYSKSFGTLEEAEIWTAEKKQQMLDNC